MSLYVYSEIVGAPLDYCGRNINKQNESRENALCRGQKKENTHCGFWVETSKQMSFVTVCSGMVPLPDTAIDFSDLRSQSSRMNERVSEEPRHLLILLMIHSHKLKVVSGETGRERFPQFSSVTCSTPQGNNSIRHVRTAGKILCVV